MFWKRLFRRPPAQAPLRVAAATTWHFPVVSHTFVYTELMGLHEMLGADVRVHAWEDAGEDSLHAAFRYLYENRKQLTPEHEMHIADKAHYRETQPERYAELFRRITELTGMSNEELEKNYQLLQAFTFTRQAEEFDAGWIQTYFYYEQSLFGLVAQWFLDIPRGVSSYADHMIEDYALKLIPLHVETASVIVATSKRIKEELISLSDAKYADKIIVKPNGADGRRFPFRERPAVDGTLKLVSISRIEEKKGLLDLVEAVKRCKDAGKNIEVHMIGAADKGNEASETYAARFEALIKELGVQDNFVLHGLMKQEQMRSIVDLCHAFIAPYVETASGDKDGIPTAILEAMSCGLPILATDAGSIPEIIDDGVEGRILPQRSPEALEAAMTKLVDDPSLVTSLSHAARARFDRQFDFRVTEKLLHERVKKAIAARPVPEGV